MNVLAIVAARGGSKGLPNKNILPLCGSPVICYTIDDALESELCDKVVCTTDDERIAAIAARTGIEVINRPARLARDDSPIEEALRHAVACVEADDDFMPDIIVSLNGNVPVRADGIIDKAVSLLIETDADAVITVTDVGHYHPNWMLEIDGTGRIAYYKSGCIYRRQELPACYVHDGAVAAVKRHVMMVRHPKTTLYSWMGEDIRAVMQRPHETVDIDDEYDFMLAEAIIRARERVLV